MEQYIYHLIGVTEVMDYGGATVIPFDNSIEILTPGNLSIADFVTQGALVIAVRGNRILGILEE